MTAWLLTFALAFDLAAVRSEPKYDKRSEKALVHADAALNTARDAYRAGEFEKSMAALQEVREAVELSWETLIGSGKNPRKDSNFKKAEKATHQLLRRLDAVRDMMSSADHEVLDPVRARINEIHDKLVTAALTGAK